MIDQLIPPLHKASLEDYCDGTVETGTIWMGKGHFSEHSDKHQISGLFEAFEAA